MTLSEYTGPVTLSDEQLTSMAVVIDACRSVGAKALPFAISEHELKDASIGVRRLAEDLRFGQ